MRRLEHFCEIRNIFPSTQCGFRRGKGTAEAIAKIVSDVQIARTEKKDGVLVR